MKPGYVSKGLQLAVFGVFFVGAFVLAVTVL